MPATGKVGSSLSAPGNLVPGLGAQLGVGATWLGPFVGQVGPIGEETITVVSGERIIVYPTIASQLAQSDLTWWEFG